MVKFKFGTAHQPISQKLQHFLTPSAKVRGHMTCHSKHSEPLFELCKTYGNNFSLLTVRFLNSSMHQRWITGPDAQVFTHNFDPCWLCWALALASLTFWALFFHFLIEESLLLLIIYTLFCQFLRVDYSKTSKLILHFFFRIVYKEIYINLDTHTSSG